MERAGGKKLLSNEQFLTTGEVLLICNAATARKANVTTRVTEASWRLLLAEPYEQDRDVSPSPTLQKNLPFWEVLKIGAGWRQKNCSQMSNF